MGLASPGVGRFDGGFVDGGALVAVETPPIVHDAGGVRHFAPATDLAPNL